MVTLSTGSRVATWTIAPTAAPRTTPVIFLHGGPGMFTTQAAMDKGAALRAAGFTTLYFDQAGGGKSDRLPAVQYRLQRAVDDVEGLRIAIKAERVILWGSSYGADVVALYARQHPGKIAGLIFTSPGFLPGTSGKRNYNLTNQGKVDISGPLGKAVRLIDSKGAAAEPELSQASAGLLFDEIVNAELLEGGVCRGAPPSPPRVLSGGNLYANRLIAKDVKSTKLPTAAPPVAPAITIHGECDFIPIANAESYRAAFGGTLVSIAKSGHNLSENRVALDAALLAFGTVALVGVE